MKVEKKGKVDSVPLKLDSELFCQDKCLILEIVILRGDGNL